MEGIKRSLKNFGLPRIIIILFFIFLCVVAAVSGLDLKALIGNIVNRLIMDGILVLAMVPGILCGIGLNFGISLGIIGGLLGACIAIEFGLAGFAAFVVALAGSIVISSFIGVGYGAALNRMKGNEMTVSTYVGFSIVALMCIGWLVLPFNSSTMRWPMGKGLRNTISLADSFGGVLNEWGKFELFGIVIPTGGLLFFALCCFLVWLFLRSKTGVAMAAVGNNPKFAEASGISVNKMRIVGTTLSTVLAAVGILVYSQSFGFIQLYNAPKMMAYSSIAAILIGGASSNKAKISHVVLGAILFQGLLVVGMTVCNDVFDVPNLSEIMRVIISYGIIVYALTRAGGGQRG